MKRKHQINENSYQMLFNFLNSFLKIEDKDFEPYLISVLKGYWCNEGEETLHKEGHVCKKGWFITKGMIYLYFIDKHKGDVVFMLFRAGEIAVVPHSFMNAAPANCYIMACADSELLEMSKTEIDMMHERFPKSFGLENAVISRIPEKYRERDSLLCLEPEVRMQTFFCLYSELHPNNKTVKMPDKNIASYLHIDQARFCRLKNKLYPKKSPE